MNKNRILNRTLNLFDKVWLAYCLLFMGMLWGVVIPFTEEVANVVSREFLVATVYILVSIWIGLLTIFLIKLITQIILALRHRHPLQNMVEEERLQDECHYVLDDLTLENKRLAVDFLGNLFDEQKKVEAVK